LNTLDVIIILIIFAAALWGYFRGLLAEIISLIGVFVGILSASRFYLVGTQALLPLLRHQKLTMFIAFLAIYMLSIVLFFLIYLVIKSNMASGAITSLSRLAAVLLGGLKSAVVIAMILLLVIFFWGPENVLTSGSKLLPRFLPYCQPIITLLPGTMQEPLGEYVSTLPSSGHSLEKGEK
jgi:membrane protein required for colicin V production